MPVVYSCTNYQGTQRDILCFGEIFWMVSVGVLLSISFVQLYRRFKISVKFRSKKVFFTIWINLNILILFVASIVAGSEIYSLQEMTFNMTFTALLYYFSIKYIKLKEGFSSKSQKIIFYTTFIVYILFLFGTFLYDLIEKNNICSESTGFLVLFGGIIPAFLLVFLGFKQTQKMRKLIDRIVENDPSVSMDYIVSKESQIDHLWELIVVYAIAKFMSLMVVIYFWVEKDQTNQNDDQDCFYLPKDRLKKEPNYYLLEILLSISIRFITIWLPLVYAIRLFWLKPLTKKDKHTNSTISINDDAYSLTYQQMKPNQDKNKKSNNFLLTTNETSLGFGDTSINAYKRNSFD